MAKLESYIEDVGIMYERFGLPRMAGRIIAYLLAAREQHISFDMLVEKLEASKGSISGNLALLTAQRLVEKYAVTGVRKSYYRFNPATMAEIIDRRMQSTQDMRILFERANALSGPENKERQAQLEEIISFYRFLEKELPAIRTRWLKSRKRKSL